MITFILFLIIGGLVGLAIVYLIIGIFSIIGELFNFIFSLFD